MRINIKEELNRRDLANYNKYDLLNTYQSFNFTVEDKKKIVESIASGSSSKDISAIMESIISKGSNVHHENSNKCSQRFLEDLEQSNPQFKYMMVEFYETPMSVGAQRLMQKTKGVKFANPADLSRILVGADRFEQLETYGYSKVYFDNYIEYQGKLYKFHAGRVDLGDGKEAVRLEDDFAKQVEDYFMQEYSAELANGKVSIPTVDKNENLLSEEYVPERTGTAYKVFKVKDGKLYPPMVDNPNKEDTPVGVWLDAQEGEFAGLSKTGRPQVKSSGGSTLAFRPGWHLGDVPRAPQFDRTNKQTGEKEFPKNFVWAECDYTMDVDYQPESDERGYMRTRPDGSTYRGKKYQHSLAGVPHVPKNGYYRYRTNPRPDTVPWIITGQMKVNRLLDDFEVAEILNDKGIEAPHRQGGDKTLEELGLTQISEQLSEDEEPTKLDDSHDENTNQKTRYIAKSYISTNFSGLMKELFTNSEESVGDFVDFWCRKGYDCEIRDTQTGDRVVKYAAEYKANGDDYGSPEIADFDPDDEFGEW